MEILDISVVGDGVDVTCQIGDPVIDNIKHTFHFTEPQVDYQLAVEPLVIQLIEEILNGPEEPDPDNPDNQDEWEGDGNDSNQW